MDIYIKLGPDNVVTYIHHTPFDSVNGLFQTREDLEKEGILTSASIPRPEEKANRRPILKFSTDTRTFYHDYEIVAPPESERLDKMENLLNAILLGEINLPTEGGE